MNVGGKIEDFHSWLEIFQTAREKLPNRTNFKLENEFFKINDGFLTTDQTIFHELATSFEIWK